MLLRTSLLAALAVTSLATQAATAAPPEARQLDAAAPLPKGIKPAGATVEQVWTWTERDPAVTGYAVFSSSERHEADGQHLIDRRLFVQLYQVKRGAAKQLRLIKDGIVGCAWDATAVFLDGSVTVTDQDGDGKAELTFAYDTLCTNDLTPATRKLLVLEGTAKHALRGRAMVADDGGDYKADPFRKEAALKAHAEARWKALLQR
jgi:hypothetical protein